MHVGKEDAKEEWSCWVWDDVHKELYIVQLSGIGFIDILVYLRE